VVQFQVGLLGPGIFDRLEYCAVLASLFGSVHQFTQGLERGVCASEDVVVVARVDGGCDEGSGFGIGAGNGEEVGSCLDM
jgi:hypothetical protein